MTADFRVSAGSTFQVESFSSSATAFRVSLLVEYDNGKQAPFEVMHTPNSDRTSATSAVGARVNRDGRVIAALLESAALKRGQCFAMIHVLNASGNKVDALLAGYVTGSKSVRLGEFEDSLSGRGFVTTRTVADDVVPADLIQTLALINTLVHVYGFVCYYNASSDVATRSANISIRKNWGSLPTGFTNIAASLSEIWSFPTLTANEEGSLHVGGEAAMGISIRNDNSTITRNTSAGILAPFPRYVNEDDPVEIFFDIGTVNANDRWSVHIFQEEWIEV